MQGVVGPPGATGAQGPAGPIWPRPKGDTGATGAGTLGPQEREQLEHQFRFASAKRAKLNSAPVRVMGMRIAAARPTTC